MARQVLENGVILPAEYSDDWYDDMTSNLTKLDDVIGSDSEKLSSADVGAAALSNNYNDLDNLPTIPTVNDAVLTIQKNGVDVQTFTANASSNVTCNITVPTKTSDLTNDSNFVDTSNPAVSSGITSAKVTSYDNHIADTDIHVTSSDKTTWNTVTSKANDSDVVHKSGNETITGEKTITDANLGFKSTSGEYGVSAGDSSVIFRDKNNLQTFKIYSRVFSSGLDNNLVNFYLTQKVDNTYYTSNGIQLFTNTGSKNAILRPILANNNADGLSISLGDSNRRWQSVYATNYYYGSNNVEFSSKFVTTDTAQTITGNKTFSSINGVEPSSLSLPSGNVSDVIDISSYITDLSGNVNNYTAPANGWIAITCSGCTGITFSIINFWANGSYRENPSQISSMIPICKNQKVGIYIYGSSSTIQAARFIPCQGNV